MNIGLNLVGIIPGTMGGFETYLRSLIRSLQKIDLENSYVVICDDHFAKEIDLFNESFTFKSVNFTKPSVLRLVRGVLRKTTKVIFFKEEINNENKC